MIKDNHEAGESGPHPSDVVVDREVEQGDMEEGVIFKVVQKVRLLLPLLPLSRVEGRRPLCLLDDAVLFCGISGWWTRRGLPTLLIVLRGTYLHCHDYLSGKDDDPFGFLVT